MSSIKKVLTSGVAILAVAATLFTGTAPAQAHDGRNAALIGGLVVGTLIGGAMASAGQPSYQSYQGYDDGYDYPAAAITVDIRLIAAMMMTTMRHVITGVAMMTIRTVGGTLTTNVHLKETGRSAIV